MGEVEPGSLFRKGEFIAIKCAPTVTAGAYFIFHPAHGGGYQPGIDPEEWAPVP